MTNQILILAAGKGTRMGGDIPKVLVALKNKPLVLYLAEEIQKLTQLIKPVVVVGYQADRVRAIMGDDFFYAYQPKQLGTAHAVLAAKDKIKAENILVLYGDMPFIKAESLRQLMKMHRGSSANVSMFTTTVPNFEGEFKSFFSAGRIIRNEASDVVKIVEVKDASDAQKQITEVNPGVYMFNTNWLWQHIEKIQTNNAQEEYYLTDIVELAIAHGQKVYSLPINPQEVIGINSKEDLEQAENLWARTA